MMSDVGLFSVGEALTAATMAERAKPMVVKACILVYFFGCLNGLVLTAKRVLRQFVED